MKRLAIIVVGWFVAVLSVSAEVATDVLDRLVSRGNHAYEMSQRDCIKECADSIILLLSVNKLVHDAQLDYAVSLYKLYGNYHYENSSLDSAAFYYHKAKSIIDEHPNVDFHGNNLLMLRELAQLYYRQADYSKAVSVMAEADDIMEFGGSYQLGDDNWLIAKMTYAMCLARVNRCDEALEMASVAISDALNKKGLNYNKALRMFGKIKLLSNADKQGALKAYKAYFREQRDSAMAAFVKLPTATAREQYWQTLRPFLVDCYGLENTDAAFLYDVALFSKGLLLQFSSDADALNSKWTDVQRKLRVGQAALEFIQYEAGGQQRMAALLLKHIGKPQFIPLTSPDSLLCIAEKSMTSTDRADKDALYRSETLQRLVWTDALLKSLTGVTRLYFAPDGYLHRLAIEYMPQVEDKELYRLTSTRKLLEPKAQLSQRSSLLLFGGINYDLDKAPGESAVNDSEAYSKYIGKRFPRLSAESNEAEDIVALRHNKADSLVSASIASECQFRKLAPLFSSILVSTHGDFCANFPLSTDVKPVVSSNALSNNIIAFAGVNSYLCKKGFNPLSSCDGLLSAKELSEMDLSRCGLFTVSACQSALGEITSDGVFGLQRGLKSAGVNTMLLSLWSVNSEATARLMRKFYSNIESGMTVHAAFKKARSEMKSEKETKPEKVVYEFDPATMSTVAVAEESRTFTTPQYTDAFILIDAID